MGAIGDALVAFAQPLLDQTDGSMDQMQKAFTLAQLCWNLALLPDEKLDADLADFRPTFKMNDEEFEQFKRSILLPMIQRHRKMFPGLHRLPGTAGSSGASPPPAPMVSATVTKQYPGTARNAPCPCNSGKKYKRCCGR